MVCTVWRPSRHSTKKLSSYFLSRVSTEPVQIKTNAPPTHIVGQIARPAAKPVDVNDSGIAALVGRGFLPEEARVDPLAIKAAVEVVISDLAFEVEQERSKGSGPRL
jgi:hypothetical protein